jgi:hypothetical protein
MKIGQNNRFGNGSPRRPRDMGEAAAGAGIKESLI